MTDRPPAPRVDPLIGREVARCKVLERIGQGGMGTVYKVRHRTLDKHLALKVLPIDSQSSQRQLEQFFVEARAQASIDHANVVGVHDADRFENWFYILMQYIDGPSLLEAMAACGPLPWPVAAQVGIGAARGLAAAHAARPPFVHQDVKPSNILLAPGWTAKVLDFGLVKTVEPEPAGELQIAGTAHYVPPEIIRGKPPSPACDLYSLGITLFEAIAGRRVFGGRTRTEVVRARLAQPAPVLSQSLPEGVEPVPPELCRLVGRLLERDPAARPESATEVAHLLEQMLAGAPLPPMPCRGKAAAAPALLGQRPSAQRIEQWARQGRTLYSCKKCRAFFLRTGHVDGQVVACPACSSKLTIPDKQSLAARRVARRTPGPAAVAPAVEEEEPVAEPVEQAAVESGADPLDRLHLPPAFIGRDWLVGRIAEAAQGQTRAVLVEGPLGMGKSRLLDELMVHLPQRRVLRLAAERRARSLAPFDELVGLALRELAQAEGFEALAARHGEWLLQICGPLEDHPALAGLRPQTVDRPERRLEAFVALLDLLFSDGRTVLLIDDAERCGARAAPLWEALGAAVARHRTLLVLAHGAPLPAELAGLPAARHKLEPLPEGLLPPLFTSIFGLARYPETLCGAINHVAQGVPADLVEVLRESVVARLLEDSDSGWSWSPDYLERRELRLPRRIDERLAAVAAAQPPLHREVLGVLALIGCSLAAAQLVEAGGFPADKLTFILNDLVKHRILDKCEDRYHFTSAGLRAKLAGAVPAGRRSGLHGRIARILEHEAADPDPPRADLLARHLEQAGEIEQAVEFRLAAARGFAREGAYQRGRDSYEAALALLTEPVPRKSSGLFRRLGRKALPDPLEVKVALADLHCRMGQTGPALQLLRQGLHAAHGRGDAALIGRCERGLALACARGADGEALTHFARIEQAPELVDARLLAEIAHLLLIRDNHARTRELLNKALALADPEPADRLGALLVLARLELRLGQWAAVGELVEQALAQLDGGHLRAEFRPRLLALQSRALVRAGELGGAGTRLEAARRYREGSLEAELELLQARAELLLARELPEAAARCAAALDRRAATAGRPYEQAWALLYRGESDDVPQRSRERLAGALDLFEKLKAPFGRARAYLGLAHSATAAGHAERARSMLEFARQQLDAAGLDWPRASLALAGSRLARLQGDAEQAGRALDEAEEIAVRTGQGLLVERVRRER